MSSLYLIFIPAIIFAIRFIAPKNYSISREKTYILPTKKLWEILTNISDYPRWQSKIEAVNMESIGSQKGEVAYVEHLANKTQIRVKQYEVAPLRRLLKLMEDDSSTCSLVFDIVEHDNGIVHLRVTEQGSIKSLHTRLYWLIQRYYGNRLDRFLDDLSLLIRTEGGTWKVEWFEKDENDFSIQDNYESQLDVSVVTAKDEFETKNSIMEPKNDNATDSVTQEQKGPDDAHFDQQAEAIDDSMIKSRSEWDLMSEIYERPDVSN